MLWKAGAVVTPAIGARRPTRVSHSERSEESRNPGPIHFVQGDSARLARSSARSSVDKERVSLRS
jgi:hypothetical protein